jgi:RimJ/RimL family protein N-acetyltransferase
MLTDHYAAYGIRLRTPRLELRLPDLDDLARLADVAADGVHDPSWMPFGVAWTDATPAVRARSVITHTMSVLATSTRELWHLPFCVVYDGQPVGLQTVKAEDYAILGEVSTGSWLGMRYQGRGIGTEMRAAVLHLAFDGLGAVYATSAAHEGNRASNGVSRRLGYAPDGVERLAVRAEVAVHGRLRLDRSAWLAHRTVPVSIDGLTDACLADLGAAPETTGAPPPAMEPVPVTERDGHSLSF